ncbi:MAG TPA: hypothetical protein PKE29_16335, partial [Phycisphaerales bacterium]|nr:hypothetical protein [Phycisphaerales bacterium]
MLRGLGHFGVFAGLYVAAAAVMFWQMAGVGNEVLPPWAAVCAVGMIASGVYALDRVKIRDSWMDPADRAAQPERYAFIAGHSRAVRVAGALCIVAGSLVGLGVSVWSPVAGALAAAGVLAYAPRGRGRARRLKDVAGIKNLYVAGGIAGLGGV